MKLERELKMKKTKPRKNQERWENRPDKTWESISVPHQPNVKVYSLFLKRTIPIFDISNQILQKEKPCIHILLQTLELQLQKVLLSFCKPEHVITIMDDIGRGIKPTLYSARENQLHDEELSVGHDTQTFIQSQGKLELKPFFRGVRKLFSSAADYMVSKFPFGDEQLMHAVVANITKR